MFSFCDGWFFTHFPPQPTSKLKSYIRPFQKIVRGMCGMPVFRGSKKAAIEAAMNFVAGVREYCWFELTGETNGLKVPLNGRMGCNGWERRDSL